MASQSSQSTPWELNTLPSPVRQSLIDLTNSGAVDSIAETNDKAQRQDFYPSSWPHTPIRLQSGHVGSSQPFLDHNSQCTDSPIPSQVSMSNGATHWDQRSMEILAKAVLAHNPNLCKNNADRGAAWEDIIREFNATASIYSLPVRDGSGIKQKFRDMVRRRRRRDAMNTWATGIVEFTSEHEALLDKYIRSEDNRASTRGQGRKRRPTIVEERNNVERERQHFAEISARVRKSPASRSMLTMRERSMASQSGASESGEEILEPHIRKRSRVNTTADVLMSMAESSERHRQDERSYRDRYLELLRDQANVQTELTRSQLDLNTLIHTDFKTKMASLEEKLRHSESQTSRMESMLSSMMGMLQDLTTPATHTARRVSIPPSLPPISQETTPQAARYRGSSVVSEVSTPSRRRSTRAPSQPQAGPYGAF